MNKEEIRHFKSLLRQGILRHTSILLDDKFQEELLNIIKNYEQLEQENKQLKEKIILLEASEPMLEFAKQTYKTNWNELKKWLEEEKNRLARQCSSIYEDSLSKTRFVNEDIYNEVKNISNKMQELEGKSE